MGRTPRCSKVFFGGARGSRVLEGQPAKKMGNLHMCVCVSSANRWHFTSGLPSRTSLTLLVYTVCYAELPQAPLVCAELSVYNVCSINTVS